MIDVSQSGFYIGDCRELLKQLPDACVQTCVTSPPYYGLRDYGHEGQLGLEETPDEYITNMVAVFAEVRRVLRDDGTLWLNIGDCYAGSGRGGYVGNRSTLEGSKDSMEQARSARIARGAAATSRYRDLGSRKPAGFHEPVRQAGGVSRAWSKPPPGYKPKELVGIPWRLAFALQAAGWYLRSDIIEEVELYCPCGCGFVLEERIWRWSQDRDLIWHKPNPLPEPVTDRPTRAHEYVFLLSKRPRYFYDADAIREPLRPKTLTTFNSERRSRGGGELVKADNWARDVRKRRAKVGPDGKPVGANKRSVWTVGTTPYDGAHFATFPPKLIEPCILAGSKPGDLVLDVFFGSGTTGEVAEKHGRRWIGFDLGYADLAKVRTAQRSLPMGVGEP